MAMRFRYPRGRSPSPVPSLGGQMFRARPVVTVTVVGPRDAWAGPVLLDTGADDTIFDEDVAITAGVDLTNAPTRYLTEIGPSGYRIRYAPVRLRLTDGIEYRDWPAMVAFTDAPLPRNVLGFAGFFQYFFGDREEVEIEINSTYPGI